MTQQLIINTPVNSGLGDPANVAFGKINANFTELYGRTTVSVLAFGADPTGVANSSTAIANAIAASPYLYWPAGTYVVNGVIQPPAGSIWISDQGATIRRAATSAQNNILLILNDFEARGIIFDANRANNANACQAIDNRSSTSRWFDCGFTGGKVVAGGYGTGMVIAQTAFATADAHRIEGCRFYANDMQGLLVLSGQNVICFGNHAYSNGDDGLSFNNYDLTFTQKINWATCVGNRCWNNSGSGIYFGNWIANNSIPSPIYGKTNNESNLNAITGNVCTANAKHGIACQGVGFAVQGNICDSNATLGGKFAGISTSAVWNSNVSDNTCTNNLGYGLDCGGMSYCRVSENTITGNSGVGINCGGSQNAFVHSNHISGNGGASGVQVQAYNLEADGNNIPFPLLCSGLSISNNHIALISTQVGISVLDGVSGVYVVDNRFICPSNLYNNCLLLIAADATVKGNRVQNSVSTQVISQSAGGVLTVPEIADYLITNSAVTVTTLNYYTALTIVGVGGIGWVTLTNGGSGYTNGATFAVTFTGGGGTGAAATAYVSNSGVVIGVRMTNYGTGYTSTPTPNFSAGVGGTGAAGTANLSVPVLNDRDLIIYANTAFTLNAAGPPVVQSKATGNIALAIRDAAYLKTFFGQWNVLWRAG